MANICWFKGIVKGKIINCEKFILVFPCYDILDKKDDCDINEGIMAFCGTSPWGICANGRKRKEVIPLSDSKIKNINEESIEKYNKYTLSDLSKLFDIEVQINACYDDDFSNEYFHFNKGLPITSECPDDLKISQQEIEDDSLSVKNIKIKMDNKTLITDRKEALKLVKKNGINIRFLSSELKNDEEIAVTAIKNLKCFNSFTFSIDQNAYDSCFMNIGEKLLDDKNFVLQNKIDLKYVSDRIKDDKDLILQYVKNNGNNLKFASERLRNDKEVVLASVKYHYRENSPIYDVGKELLKDKDFIFNELIPNDCNGLVCIDLKNLDDNYYFDNYESAYNSLNKSIDYLCFIPVNFFDKKLLNIALDKYKNGGDWNYEILMDIYCELPLNIKKDEDIYKKYKNIIMNKLKNNIYGSFPSEFEDDIDIKKYISKYR